MLDTKKNKILKRFPKKRNVLSESYIKIYEEHYKNNRAGSGTATSIAKRLEKWMHKKVSADVEGEESSGKLTLEIGAGNLNHLEYEKNVINYDIVEPFEVLYIESVMLKRVRSVYKNICEIESPKNYDRIISIAVLEHVCELPKLIARSVLLLNVNGVFRAAIPSEGGLLWGLAWRLSTGMEFWLKYKIPYGKMMAYEHVNNASEIECILKIFFETCKIKSFGFGKNLSFYRYYECLGPKLELAREFLESYENS